MTKKRLVSDATLLAMPSSKPRREGPLKASKQLWLDLGLHYTMGKIGRFYTELFTTELVELGKMRKKLESYQVSK